MSTFDIVYLSKGRRSSPCNWLRWWFYRSISSKAVCCTGFAIPPRTKKPIKIVALVFLIREFQGWPFLPARESKQGAAKRKPGDVPGNPLIQPGFFSFPVPWLLGQHAISFLTPNSRNTSQTWKRSLYCGIFYNLGMYPTIRPWGVCFLAPDCWTDIHILLSSRAFKHSHDVPNVRFLLWLNYSVPGMHVMAALHYSCLWYRCLLIFLFYV